MDLRHLMRNQCASLVRMSNRERNTVRSSPSESHAHFMAKKRICRDLELEGKEFITEAIFVKGGRADILVLDDFRVIEVACTEREDSLLKKKEVYPEGLTIEVVRVGRN